MEAAASIPELPVEYAATYLQTQIAGFDAIVA
jgi:hypothetical protein